MYRAFFLPRAALVGWLIFFLLLPGAGFAAEGPIATVGGMTLTEGDLNREVQKLLPLNVSFHGGISDEKIAEVKAEALETLIEKTFKVQYALANELSVDPAGLEARFAKLKERYKSPEQMRRAYNGMTPRAIRASLYRDMLAQRAEEMAVTDRIEIDPAAVKAYYEKNRERFKRPRSFQASHILVRVDPSANKEERAERLAKAEDLYARAKQGEDFYNLAYYNSDDRTRYVGGDLGTFHEGQTVPEFEKALKEMEPGEIAGPIQTLYGYHIVKLVDVKPPRQLTFDEMQGQIEKQLFKERRDALYAQWIEQLRQQFPVERL